MLLKLLKKLSKPQLLLIITGLLLLFWFSPLASFVLNIGSWLGMAFAMLILLTGVFLKKIKAAVKKFREKRLGKIVFSVVAALLSAAMLYTLTITGFMISRAENKPPADTNAIVLGCSLNGSKPSRMLQRRLDAAFVYLIENKKAVCVLSGGQGKGEDMPEATAMLNYLKEKGIDENRLFTEEKSTSTQENIKFSMAIIESQNLSGDIAIITNGFHQFRASVIAKKNGINPYAINSKTGLFSLPTFYIRELLAISKELL